MGGGVQGLHVRHRLLFFFAVSRFFCCKLSVEKTPCFTLKIIVCVFISCSFLSLCLGEREDPPLPAHMTCCLVEVVVHTANDVPNLAKTELALGMPLQELMESFLGGLAATTSLAKRRWGRTWWAHRVIGVDLRHSHAVQSYLVCTLPFTPNLVGCSSEHNAACTSTPVAKSCQSVVAVVDCVSPFVCLLSFYVW